MRLALLVVALLVVGTFGLPPASAEHPCYENEPCPGHDWNPVKAFVCGVTGGVPKIYCLR